ncbi:hypothetical protein M0R45_031304 [Rubus argutus]|uniref:Uncharacterized protein n=1 Tax=Rubus argutus TaxID=59490 RepID=A0AAW1WG18_RUBAR
MVIVGVAMANVSPPSWMATMVNMSSSLGEQQWRRCIDRVAPKLDRGWCSLWRLGRWSRESFVPNMAGFVGFLWTGGGGYMVG